MTTITIKCIGPIKDVTLAVKRVNVFIGPQATGKSTIAKIISQARWAEKTYLTTGEKVDFYEQLIDFHKLEAMYFSKDSVIVYDTPWCRIHVQGGNGKRTPKTTYTQKVSTSLYHNTKVEYIPAERNFVSSIANIQKYSESYNSTIGFLNDWYAAKANYQRNRQFRVDLPDLRFSYRYIAGKNSDIIKMANNEELELQSASSGQQSILPLMLVAEDVMLGVYSTQKVFSPAEQQHIKRRAKDLSPIVDLLSSLGKRARTKEVEEQLDKLWMKIGYNADYGCTHLIIEEPEQNLYPSTQRGLIRHLINCLKKDKRHEHTLTLTTHSPYVLYALNNCMLAGRLEAEGKQAELKRMGVDAVVNPEQVGLWLLHDGGMVSLQDVNTSLLQGDVFNDEFQKNHEEMFKLLKLMD